MTDIYTWIAVAAVFAGTIGYIIGRLHGVQEGIATQQRVQYWLDLGEPKSAIRAARGEIGGYPPPPPPPRR